MKTIKIMLLLAFSLIAGTNLFAQQQTTPSSNAINAEISGNFKLRDDIVLQNFTQSAFAEVTMTATDENGKIIAMSRAIRINPAGENKIYTTSHNKLKQLRGKKLSLKIKGLEGETSDNFRILLEENHHDLYIKVFSRADY